MNVPRHIIRLAHNLALKAKPVRNQRTVAIIFDKKYVEGVGIAVYKTHPLQTEFSKFAYLHAETDAITHAFKHVTSPNRRFKLADCAIYVHRIKPNNTVGLAQPCVNCAQMLSIVGITQIFWSK